MRSVRMLLATATATAALAIAPPAHAVTTGDWDQEGTSHSKDQDTSPGKDHGKDQDTSPGKDHGTDHGKDHGEESYGKDHQDTSHGDFHDKDHEKDSYSKEHDNGSKHDEPHGGVHTGGGALAVVTNGDDWGGSKDPKHEPDSYRTKDEGHGKDSWKEEEHSDDSWKGDHENDAWGGGDHDKPRGGMHTGGGGLSTPGVTAGGLAVLGAAGVSMYALRRRKAGESLA